LLTLSGFIYGVGLGFLLNFFSALTGATLCFSLSRYFYRRNGDTRKSNGVELVETRSIRSSRSSSQLLQSNTDTHAGSNSLGKENNETHLLRPNSIDSLHSTTDLLPSPAKRHSTTQQAFASANGRSASFELTSVKPAAYFDTAPPFRRSLTDIEEQSDGEPIDHQPPTPETKPKQSLFSRYNHFLICISRYLKRHPNHLFRFLLALRLAPYPFTVLNALLAHIEAVSLHQFMLVTAVSLLKTCIHAWIGSTLTDISQIIHVPHSPRNGTSAGTGGGNGTAHDPQHGGEGYSTAQVVEFSFLGVAVLIAFVGGYYLYRMVERALAENEEETVEMDSNTVT
jgi:hypothetical protein